MTFRSALRLGRRVVRRGRMGLRREWRHGRLDLRDLPRGTRRLAKIALLLIGASAVIVVARALGLGLPGPSFDIPREFLAEGRVEAVPLLPVIVAAAGMSVAAAGLAVANQLSDRRVSRVALVGISVLGLAVSSQLVGAGGDLARVEVLVAADHPIPSPPASFVIDVGGSIGIACALMAICLALAPARRINPWLLAAVATAPFALTAILILGIGYESFDLGTAAAGFGLPQILTARSYVAPALTTVDAIVGFWLVPLVLWQVVTWARASRREVGGPIAARDVRWPWLLVALLTIKLGWLALGYAGRLPSVLGGGAPVWGRVIGDGLTAWLIAAAFACLAGWWLANPRRVAVSERGFTPAAILVVIGFSAVTIVMSLALVALPIAGLLPGTPLSSTLAAACTTNWTSEAIGNAARCLVVQTTDRQFELTILVQLGTLIAALVISAWLWRGPGRRSTILFLMAVVVWVAPRVPDAVGALLGLPPGPSIAPELATFDTALTIVIAVLAVAWYTGRQRGAGPPALLLVIVVATLLVHAGTAVPQGSTTTFFFLALLFPVAYELFFDSEAVNFRRPERPARVLESLGIRVGVLSLVALGIALGNVRPTEAGWDQLGRTLFAVPFSALLVAATLSRQQEPANEAATERAAVDEPTTEATDRAVSPEPRVTPLPDVAVGPGVQRRVLALGVAGGALGLTVMVGLGAVADTALARFATAPIVSTAPMVSAAPTATLIPDASPTPVRRLAEFASRTSSAHGLLQDRLKVLGDPATGAAEVAADGYAIERLAADERGWLRANPPADCYATAVRDWEIALDRLTAFGQRVGAITDINDPAAVSAVSQAGSDFNAADSAFLDSLDKAAASCGTSPSPSV
jgi:hypothetical protein